MRMEFVGNIEKVPLLRSFSVVHELLIYTTLKESYRKTQYAAVNASDDLFGAAS